MIVTNLNYALQDAKIHFLNFCIKRVTERKHQNVIGTDGTEGYGKSTITAADAYYMSWAMKRPLALFFKIDALNQYAIDNQDRIIIYDDVALAGLTIEGYNKAIVRLIKILLLARKNRNTFFLNIQEFQRMKEPLIARMIGLNHVYSPDDIELGNYTFYNKLQLQMMFAEWQKRKRVRYGDYSHMGTFPNVLYDIFDEKEYERLKDEAIKSIGEDEEKKRKCAPPELIEAKVLMHPKLSYDEKAEIIGVSHAEAFSRHKKLLKVYPNGAPVLVSSQIQADKYNSVDYIMPKDTNYLKETPILINLPLKRKKQEADIEV